MQHERTGVDVAHRIDQAHDTAGAAQVESGQRLTERRQMEERVAGEHVGVIHEPVVELTLLLVGGMERFPRVGATARRAKAGQSELGAVVVGHRLELVDLRDVVAGHHHRDLETLEPGGLEVLHRLNGRGERTFAADMIVGVGVGAVDRDLHIDVV